VKCRHLDLFSGIGGFALAGQRVWGDEHEIVAFVEKDEYCQKVLKKHWPDVPVIGDIRDVTDTISGGLQEGGNAGRQPKGSELGRRSEGAGMGIDLITGGFPCQPFSQAGKRDGRSDDRHLWPEMLRIIQLFKPTWVIAENVRGLLSIEDGVVFEQVCTDLEDAGYDVQPFVIPAVAVDAYHRRDRVWFVAHTQHPAPTRQRERGGERLSIPESEQLSSAGCDVADARSRGLPQPTRPGLGEFSGQAGAPEGGESRGRMSAAWRDWPVEPDVGRVAHGVPHRVDRLRALGNAIVPQVAAQIMRAMKYPQISC